MGLAGSRSHSPELDRRARGHIPTYPAGSWGPAEANRLFDSDDQTWRDEL